VSIEQEAEKDLALSEDDADGIVGGKRTKKAGASHASSHVVPFIKVPKFSGTPDDTLPPSDCAPDDSTM